MLEQNPDLDVIVTSIGGGGLASGVACAAKGRKPSIKVIGVQTSRLPSMAAALAAGEPVRMAGRLTVPLVR